MSEMIFVVRRYKSNIRNEFRQVIQTAFSISKVIILIILCLMSLLLVFSSNLFKGLMTGLELNSLWKIPQHA